MQIYWNKRMRLHKKRVQLPQDPFGTPTWPLFHCFVTPIGTLRVSLPKTGPLPFGWENQFPLNFAHEYILVQK